MAESRPNGLTTRLLPHHPSPFSVHLMRKRGDESSGTRFTTVASHDDHMRAFCAAIVSETGVVLREAILYLATPSSDPSPFPDMLPEADNRDDEQRWTRLRTGLERLQDGSHHFPELILPSGSDDATIPLWVPPTLFFPVANLLVPIPCPFCLAPLNTCRDDGLLERHHLPLWSSSAVRLLYCRECSQDASEPLFVASESTPAAEAPLVVDLDELRGRLAATLNEKGEPEGTTHSPIYSAWAADPAAGPAAEWTVFTPHDTPFILASSPQQSLGETAAIIAGCPCQETEHGDGQPPTFLLAMEGSGVDAVELLALKLRLFVQLLRGVRTYHRRLGAPHLNLHPETIVVGGDRGGSVPAAWHLESMILPFAAGRTQPITDELEVTLPPQQLTAPFFSPAVRDVLLVAPRSATLNVNRLVSVDGDDSAWRIEARLADPQGVYPTPQTDDLVLLHLENDVLGISVTRMAARIRNDSPSAGPPRHWVTTEPLAIEPTQAARLQNVAGLQIPGVRYKIYPQLGVADDMFSLGMILLQTLLVNDRIDLASVAGAVTSTITDIPDADEQPAAQVLEGSLATLLGSHPGVFAKSNLFFREVDRGDERPNSVPDPAWRQALLTALRLMAPALLGKRAGSQSTLDEAIADVEHQLGQLHAIVFQRQPVHLEMQSVLAEMLTEEERRIADG